MYKLLVIGKATKLRQLCQSIWAKILNSYREMTGQNQTRLPETVPYSQQTKGKYRLLIKENVFLDSFVMACEEHNFKKVASLGEQA